MSYANPLTCPAYYVEQIAFDPSSQLSAKVQREVFARIAAIAAPIFYLYQVCLHGAIAAVDCVLCLLFLSPGKLCEHAFTSCLCSVKNLFSSFLEIPHKLVLGPKHPPNYLGTTNRYSKIWRSAYLG